MIPMVYGEPVGQALQPDAKLAHVRLESVTYRETWWSLVPPLALGAAALVLGLYLPKQLLDLVEQAAIATGAK